MSPLSKNTKKTNGVPEEFWSSVYEHRADINSSQIEQTNTELNAPVSRLEFLRLMGASMALASFTGCRRPLEHIVPYVKQPEEVIPGIPLHYATTMSIGEDVFGLVVESHEGRPTKIEGNEKHPSNRGKASSLNQASILSLYDPDRSKSVMHDDSTETWMDFISFWREIHTNKKGNKGEGLAILTESFSSPSLIRLKNAFLRDFPKADWVCYEPISNESIYEGITGATGKSFKPVYQYDKAEVIVSLDCDFLLTETDNVINGVNFSKSRDFEKRKKSMNRLYSIESTFSITGSMADHRLPLRCSDIIKFCVALAMELRDQGISIPGLDKIDLNQYRFDHSWLKAIASDLIGAKGKGIVVAGKKQPGFVHALVIAINSGLKNIGKTVRYYEMLHTQSSSNSEFSKLILKMSNSEVDTLVMLGGNPAYNAPTDLNFAKTLKKVQTSIHLSPYFDETSSITNWHIPQSHFLESWGDAASTDGTVSIVQPLIAPLFPSKTTLECLQLICYGTDKNGYGIVRDTWNSSIITNNFEREWRRALHDGLLSRTSAKLPSFTIDAGRLANYFQSQQGLLTKTETGFELVFQSSPSVFDGRFSNNGWLQELPDPITKLMWDNVALISPKTAEEINIDLKKFGSLKTKDYQMIKLSYQGQELDMPVYVIPGLADNSVMVTLGYGRTKSGVIGNKVGFDTYKIRTSGNLYYGSGLKISLTGNTYPLSTSQDYHKMEGRPLIREAIAADFINNQTLTPPLPVAPDLVPLWKNHSYDKSPQWGMSIDLNVCTGCNACVIACQSENNIPVVGKKEAGYGREMHWIRIDRYFTGSESSPKMVKQPVPCMHCENAPCEQVCPVQATNHDKEGLNAMVYNRCIGTRYCANNCPYKVRRFNFYNFTKGGPETRIRGEKPQEIQKMSQNPDVTVRSRGVMEKCTYCIQRINQGKINSKVSGNNLKDGDIKTACQQTCPVGAISFGDIAKEKSNVSKMKQLKRNYVMLGEWHTKPRTSYLGVIRNPNNEIEPVS